jgi:integrase
VKRYQGLQLRHLRNFGAELALDGGAQLNDVQALLRHTNSAMTMRYLRRGGRQRSADAIGRMLAPGAPDAATEKKA